MTRMDGIVEVDAAEDSEDVTLQKRDQKLQRGQRDQVKIATQPLSTLAGGSLCLSNSKPLPRGARRQGVLGRDRIERRVDAL
jgi:hypothetical protein